jgi:hypothetical protein
LADTCCQYTFGSLTVNKTTGDTLLTDFDGGDIDGLDGAPIRSQIDPQGQSDGGIVHQKFYGPRVITFTGAVLIRSVTDPTDAAYITAVNAVISAAKTALEAQLNTATNLAWTETGGAGKTISCTYGTEGGEFKTNGNMLQKKFTFSLVAADPTIS